MSIDKDEMSDQMLAEIGKQFAAFGEAEFRKQLGIPGSFLGEAPSPIDILQELEKIKQMMEEQPRPFWDDPDKKYVVFLAKESPSEIIQFLSGYKNLEVKEIAPQYLPNKGTLYFIPKIDDPVRFRYLPYTSHLQKEEEK